MDSFVIVIIAIIAFINAILISEIVYMRSRLDYLERRFIDMRGNINYLFNELENKKC